MTFNLNHFHKSVPLICDPLQALCPLQLGVPRGLMNLVCTCLFWLLPHDVSIFHAEHVVQPAKNVTVSNFKDDVCLLRATETIIRKIQPTVFGWPNVYSTSSVYLYTATYTDQHHATFNR